MIYRFTSRLAFFVVIALGGAVPCAAQTSSDTLDRLDQMRRQGQFDEAITTLERMKQEQPNNADVLWILSRARIDRANLQYTGEKQEAEYQKAIEEARTAVEAEPKNDEAHLALAIASGRVALNADTRTKVKLSRGVKEHVDQAIALNPKNDLAYHVRGRWNYEVAELGWLTKQVVKAAYGGLPDATYESAAADLEQAIEIKDRVVHRLELGKAYLKLDQEAQAKAQFERALKLPSEYPADEKFKEEAREQLNKMS